MTTKAERKQALNELWNRGILVYKLHDAQKIMMKAIVDDTRDIITVLCSRRFGKSFYLTLLAVETCIKNPGCIVKYVCPKLKQVKTVIKPIMRQIINDAPIHLKPEWKENDKTYVFPNGSEIQLAGTDNGSAETLRGGASILCIVDEAGFCDDLKYVINEILAPTTDTTNGRIILSSTPSRSSEHEFIQNYVLPAEALNKLIKFTIYDNPMMTAEKISRIIGRFPLGVKDPGFRREYLCEVINDSDDIVIPEWQTSASLECIKPWSKPAYYDIYVSSDVGFRDLTVVLFGYYDFLEAKLIIEDELVMNGPEMTTEALANEIKKKEALRFSDNITKEPIPPFMRIMDNNLILINDLQRLHNLVFLPTRKDNKEAAINKLRMMVSNKQIVIHPRCKTLLYHLKNATWDKNRKEFRRMANTPDQQVLGGHADALDALLYMVRNVMYSKNPFPSHYNHYKGDNVFVNPNSYGKKENGLTSTIKKMLNIKT